VARRRTHGVDVMRKDSKRQMGSKLLRRVIIILSGTLFAVYAAYNLFIVVKDGTTLSAEGMFISIVVALLFAVFAFFGWTAGVAQDKPLFSVIRRIFFLVALLAVFLLKLRMAWQVADYFDPSLPYTVLYTVSYVLTQLALLLLLVFYFFILNNYEQFPRASVLLPLTSLLLFVCSFVLEIILFFAFGIITEASPLRTLVIRPVFYLGFIGLSVYFLIPAPVSQEQDGYTNIGSDDTFIDGNVYE